MSRKVSPRISDLAATFYAQNFSSLNAGAEYVLDSFPMLYRHALASAWGVFTEGELLLMLDACKDLMLTPQLIGCHLIAAVRNAIELSQAHEEWSVSPAVFIGKLNGLPVCVVAGLEVWCRAFFESEEFKKGDRAAIDYVAYISRKEGPAQ